MPIDKKSQSLSHRQLIDPRLHKTATWPVCRVKSKQWTAPLRSFRRYSYGSQPSADFLFAQAKLNRPSVTVVISHATSCFAAVDNDRVRMRFHNYGISSDILKTISGVL
jgi:hypothetical protein